MAAEGSSYLILLNGTKVAGLAITRMIALSLPGGALPEMKLGDLRNMRNNWPVVLVFFSQGEGEILMMIIWPLARGGGTICRHFVNLSLREEGGFLSHTQTEKEEDSPEGKAH